MIARYLLNIYASAILSFLFSMGVVFLFSRLKKPRFLACLFFLPFLKVLWDLLFSSAPNWVYLQNLSSFMPQKIAACSPSTPFTTDFQDVGSLLIFLNLYGSLLETFFMNPGRFFPSASRPLF